MITTEKRATLDTNVAVYALTIGPKTTAASAVVRRCAFLSVQVLNEYANAMVRKRMRTLADAVADLDVLSRLVPEVASIGFDDHRTALRISDRYRLSFYDSLMAAVALGAGAQVLYSEDMHHELVIDGLLTVINPFIASERS